MGSFESMTQKLRHTGLYTVESGSYTERELRVYALELDNLRALLDEMTREYFIVTAQTYGLSERESFIGKERSSDTLSKRRNYLIYKGLPPRLRVTPADFHEFLQICGINNFEFIFYEELLMKLVIHDTLTKLEKTVLEEKIFAEISPALNLIITYT